MLPRVGAAFFLLEWPQGSGRLGAAQCAPLQEEELRAVPRAARRPMAECEGEADEMGRPLGSAHRGAVYNTARLPHNASFLSDVWLFRLPQTPRQPPVRRDGLPRS